MTWVWKDKWWKWWPFNFMTGLAHLFYGIIGKWIPAPKAGVMDVEIQDIDLFVLHAAAEHARAEMLSQGWDEWKKEALDCDDYAMKMRVEIIKHLVDNGELPEGKAAPVWLFGYTKSGGAGHMCLEVGLKEKRYWEVYPWVELELDLTPKEVASMRFRF